MDWKGKKILIMPLYYPAAALRSTQLLNVFQADFAKLPGLLQSINQPAVPAPEPEPEIPANQQLSLV